MYFCVSARISAEINYLMTNTIYCTYQIYSLVDITALELCATAAFGRNVGGWLECPRKGISRTKSFFMRVEKSYRSAKGYQWQGCIYWRGLIMFGGCAQH